MTFLEFVLCEKLLGDPVYRTENSAYWNCPFHSEENPSFHTLPTKPGEKNRFRCWSCGEWGDEHDLLKNEMPHLSYSRRMDLLSQWQEEYALQSPDDASSRGDSRSTTSAPADDPQDIAQAFAVLDAVVSRPVPSWASDDDHFALYRLLVHAVDVAWTHGVVLDALAAHCAQHIINKRDPVYFRDHNPLNGETELCVCNF